MANRRHRLKTGYIAHRDLGGMLAYWTGGTHLVEKAADHRLRDWLGEPLARYHHCLVRLQRVHVEGDALVALAPEHGARGGSRAVVPDATPRAYTSFGGEIKREGW